MRGFEQTGIWPFDPETLLDNIESRRPKKARTKFAELLPKPQRYRRAKTAVYRITKHSAYRKFDRGLRREFRVISEVVNEALVTQRHNEATAERQRGAKRRTENRMRNR